MRDLASMRGSTQKSGGDAISAESETTVLLAVDFVCS